MDEAERKAWADNRVLAALVCRKANRKLGRPTPTWILEIIEEAEREGSRMLDLVT